MADSLNDREFEVVGTLTDDCQYIEIADHSILKRIIGRLRGEKLIVKFRKLFYTRSDAQNRYIWGVVVPIVRGWVKETSGEMKTKDEVYIWLRKSLLGHEINITEVLGEQVLTMGGKRFSKMTTKEFTEAIDLIIDRMAERGVTIPLPKPKGHNFLTEFIDE